MYKLILLLPENTITSVRRTSDGAFIPFDPANTDAQEFASWLWAGNKPESAEEGGTVSDEWVEETLNKFGYKNGVGG